MNPRNSIIAIISPTGRLYCVDCWTADGSEIPASDSAYPSPVRACEQPHCDERCDVCGEVVS